MEVCSGYARSWKLGRHDLKPNDVKHRGSLDAELLVRGRERRDGHEWDPLSNVNMQSLRRHIGDDNLVCLRWIRESAREHLVLVDLVEPGIFVGRTERELSVDDHEDGSCLFDQLRPGKFPNDVGREQCVGAARIGDVRHDQIGRGDIPQEPGKRAISAPRARPGSYRGSPEYADKHDQAGHGPAISPKLRPEPGPYPPHVLTLARPLLDQEWGHPLFLREGSHT